ALLRITGERRIGTGDIPEEFDLPVLDVFEEHHAEIRIMLLINCAAELSLPPASELSQN
ncbi:Hypothetical predicted protein, partial [Podarcis lilfordi]